MEKVTVTSEEYTLKKPNHTFVSSNKNNYVNTSPLEDWPDAITNSDVMNVGKEVTR